MKARETGWFAFWKRAVLRWPTGISAVIAALLQVPAIQDKVEAVRLGLPWYGWALLGLGLLVGTLLYGGYVQAMDMVRQAGDDERRRLVASHLQNYFDVGRDLHSRLQDSTDESLPAEDAKADYWAWQRGLDIFLKVASPPSVFAQMQGLPTLPSVDIAGLKSKLTHRLKVNLMQLIDQRLEVLRGIMRDFEAGAWQPMPPRQDGASSG